MTNGGKEGAVKKKERRREVLKEKEVQEGRKKGEGREDEQRSDRSESRRSEGLEFGEVGLGWCQISEWS